MELEDAGRDTGALLFNTVPPTSFIRRCSYCRGTLLFPLRITKGVSVTKLWRWRILSALVCVLFRLFYSSMQRGYDRTPKYIESNRQKVYTMKILYSHINRLHLSTFNRFRKGRRFRCSSFPRTVLANTCSNTRRAATIKPVTMVSKDVQCSFTEKYNLLPVLLCRALPVITRHLVLFFYTLATKRIPTLSTIGLPIGTSSIVCCRTLTVVALSSVGQSPTSLCSPASCFWKFLWRKLNR